MPTARPNRIKKSDMQKKLFINSFEELAVVSGKLRQKQVNDNSGLDFDEAVKRVKSHAINTRSKFAHNLKIKAPGCVMISGPS